MSHWKEFRVERHDRSGPDVTTWRLAGTLTNTKESYEFLDALRDAVRDRPCAQLLNLEKVEHVTSAGVGIIAAAYTSATNAKAPFGLACLSPQVRTVLSLVNLLSLLTHEATEDLAIARLTS